MTKKQHNFSLRDFLFTYGFLLVLLLVIVYFSVTAPSFFSMNAAMSILHTAAPLLIIASGLAFVIMTKRIDISVGSIAYLSAAIGALMISRMGLPIPLSCLMGVLNGFFVVILNVNPMIATFGTQLAFRGIGLLLTNSMVVSLPRSIRFLGNKKVGPIYIDILFSLFILLIMMLIHSRTQFGRQVVAIGNDISIAEKLGIKEKRISFFAYVVCGLMAGIGAIIMSLQVGSVTPTSGTSYEFTAIAMLVIGGVSLYGGEGTILPGVLIGGITLAVIETGLNYIGASVYVYSFVRGGVIFVSMFADSLKTQVKPKVKIMEDEPTTVSNAQ
jgi:ribose/xylose/arabinose/galactoside ABC-type transport system permease subunit